MTDSLGGAWRIAVSTLERLYYEYEPRVRWMMHARGVEASSVDDLVHESFMTILRRWPRRDRSIPLAVWVVRVARNVAFSHRRAEARRRRRHQELPPPQAPAAPDEIAAGREAWHELDAFTRQLPPKLREAFVLADVGGVPVHEIAEACGVPVATMHSRLRLSRRRFAEHFARHRDAEARAAMLRRATTEARPSPEARRRSLAALLASAELPVATTAAAGTVTSTVTAWVVASVVAGVGAMVVIDRSLDPPPEPLAAAAGRQDAPAGRRDARSAKAAALSGVVESAAAVEQPETTVAVTGRVRRFGSERHAGREGGNGPPAAPAWRGRSVAERRAGSRSAGGARGRPRARPKPDAGRSTPAGPRRARRRARRDLRARPRPPTARSPGGVRSRPPRSRAGGGSVPRRDGPCRRPRRPLPGPTKRVDRVMTRHLGGAGGVMFVRFLSLTMVFSLGSFGCEVDSESAGSLVSDGSEEGGGSAGSGGGSCDAEVFADDFDRSCVQDSECVAVYEGPVSGACRECAFSAINVAEQAAYVAALGPLSCSDGPCAADCIRGHLQPSVCVEDQCELGEPFVCGAGDSGGFEEGTVPCDPDTGFCIGLEPNNYACIPLPEPCEGSTDCACLVGSGDPANLDVCLEEGSCEHDGATFQVRCPDG